MVKVSSIGETTACNTKITRAADFLIDLHQKGYKDADLRKYLANKRGLSFFQVNQAFDIRDEKVKFTANANRKSQIVRARTSANRTSNIKLQEVKTAERPKNSLRSQLDNTNLLAFLQPDKRAAGKTLIKQFLTSEWNYCIVLECLLNDYKGGLTKMIEQRRLWVEKSKIDKFFVHIPRLLEFHRTFYEELSRGSSIGRMFVRLANFFKGYAQYMKDCASAVRDMKEYNQNNNWQDCLKEIQKRSRRRIDEMTDLLLVPLDRVMDYNNFVDKLYLWADTSQLGAYECLSKAARSIGRVSKYIAQYKHAIVNKNEMNKIQTFMGKQCEIISLRRRIVRRGMMIRRTTRWPKRNKRYIFFLFNDVMVWTTRKGLLKNAVLLSRCIVSPSDSRKNYERKFNIVVSMEDRGDKLLMLECTSKKQRDKWYNAVESTISAIGKSSSVFQIRDIVNPKFDFRESSISEKEAESTLTLRNLEESGNVSAEEKEKAIIEIKQNIDNDITSEYDTSFDAGCDLMHNFYYEQSRAFVEQELKEIESMEDAESQISEFEQKFYEKHTRYKKVRNESTILSPLVKKITPSFDAIDNCTPKGCCSSNVEINSLHRAPDFQEQLKEQVPKSVFVRKPFVDPVTGGISIVEPSSRVFKKNRSRSSIIRRPLKKSSPEATQRFEGKASLRIRLDDGMLSFGSGIYDFEPSFTHSVRLSNLDEKPGEFV